MKTLATAMTFSAVLTLSAWVQAADPGMSPGLTPEPQAGSSDLSSGPSTSGSMVQGEVLKIEGDTYLIKDSAGKEVRLRVTNDTKMGSAFQVGDKIEANVAADGQAMSIQKVDVAGSK